MNQQPLESSIDEAIAQLVALGLIEVRGQKPTKSVKKKARAKRWDKGSRSTMAGSRVASTRLFVHPSINHQQPRT
jgi:hypothetical protein